MMNREWVSSTLIAAAVMLGAWSLSGAAAEGAQGKAAAPSIQVQQFQWGKADERTGQQFPSSPAKQSEKPTPTVGGNFGCPWNEYQCFAHCKEIGKRAGECGGVLWVNCNCHN